MWESMFFSPPLIDLEPTTPTKLSVWWTCSLIHPKIPPASSNVDPKNVAQAMSTEECRPGIVNSFPSSSSPCPVSDSCCVPDCQSPTPLPSTLLCTLSSGTAMRSPSSPIPGPRTSLPADSWARIAATTFLKTAGVVTMNFLTRWEDPQEINQQLKRLSVKIGILVETGSLIATSFSSE